MKIRLSLMYFECALLIPFRRKRRMLPGQASPGTFTGRGSVPLSLVLLSVLLLPAGATSDLQAGIPVIQADTAQYDRWKALAGNLSADDPDSSLYFLELLEGMEGITPRRRADILKLKADAFYYKYDFARAAGLYRESGEIEKSLLGEISLPYAERTGDVGFCYFRMVDYPKAVENFKQALSIVREIGHKEETATNLNNIGMIFNSWGLYDSSIRYHTAALEIDKAIGDPYSISVDYNNIGKIYEAWGKYEIALDYYREALQYARISGQEMSIAIRLNNIGMIYKIMGNYPRALEYLEEALGIDTRMNNRYRMAVRYHNMGQIQQAMGKPAQAGEYYAKALELFRELGHIEGQAYVYTSLGEQHFLNRAYADAEGFFLKSLRIADSMHLAQAVINNYERLAGLYEGSGDYQRALECSKILASVKDSLFTENEQKLMTEFRTKYETEKKEREIELLSKEQEISALRLRKANIQLYSMIGAVVLLAAIVLLAVARYRFKHRMNLVLEEKNDRLETLNATKDKFFAIISHDLRNPMAGIRNIAQALSDNLGSLSSGDLRRLVGSLKDSAQGVHELMQNLLLWAGSQRGTTRFEPQPLDLDEQITRSIGLVRQKAEEKDIRVRFVPDGSPEVQADENMVQTILRNLITNSVKFTDPGGRIEIRTFRENGFITVSVADTGVGIAAGDMDKLFRIDQDFKTIGRSAEKGSGLGLILCREFVERHGGSISADSTEGKGSTFTFTLPQSIGKTV